MGVICFLGEMGASCCLFLPCKKLVTRCNERELLVLLVKRCQGTTGRSQTRPLFRIFLAQGPRPAGAYLLEQEIRVMFKKKTLGCQIDSPNKNSVKKAKLGKLRDETKN
jgi:hypothetical protein